MQTTVSTAYGICHTVTSTCHYQPSSGAQTAVSTAAGICHTVTGVAVTVWQIPDAVDTVVCAPDDG
jgi:hypothetical protein